MYPKYKSKYGYYIDEDEIDSYGVDHKNFSIRDELEYQIARQEQENKYENQGGTQNSSPNTEQQGYTIENKTTQSPLQQVIGGVKDMATEYFNMKNHGYKNLDDYHHCKANYNAASRGPYGYNTAKFLGDAKEQFDFRWNKAYKGLSENEAQDDKNNDESNG
ncbi:MAG: hypothetical protein IKA03_05040 [Alphaproteobacteria bacterium]|nr:hypothetical protein [Alphaproteobacteria bacterium]